MGRAPSPIKLAVDNLTASEKTQVEDLRPSTEGTRQFFGTNSRDDRFGYARIEQDATDPSGPRLFAHHLQEGYGSEPVPITKLHHFVVYLNNRSKANGLHRRADFSGSTAEHDVAKVHHTVVDPEIFAICSGEDEYKRAFYDEPGIPAGTPAFVVYVESESQQKRRFTRTVWPIKPPQISEKIPLHQALDAAIRFNLE